MRRSFGINLGFRRGWLGAEIDELQLNCHTRMNDATNKTLSVLARVRVPRERIGGDAARACAEFAACTGGRDRD